MGDPTKGRTGWRRYAPESIWTIILGPIIVGLTIAGITAVVAGLFSDEPSFDLVGLEPVVHNGPAEHEQVTLQSGRLASRPTDESAARVEFRLKNEGERRSYITGATFTIDKLIEVPPCGVGAGIVLSGHYRVILPRDAREGETIEVPIDRQLPPDGVDRFEFRIGREFSKRDVGPTFIYQLDVGLRHDNAEEPASIGKILVALPGTPSVDSLALDLPPAERGCAEEARQSFEEANQLDGIRSPALEHLTVAAAQG